MIKLNISKEEIDIFTDGSCSGNPGPGGWSGVIIHDLISILTGYETNTTNNRMELMATINVIKLIDPRININLYTDSNYVKRKDPQEYIDKLLYFNSNTLDFLYD